MFFFIFYVLKLTAKKFLDTEIFDTKDLAAFREDAARQSPFGDYTV